MSCPKCLKQPQFHSFSKCGQLQKNNSTINLFYSSLAKSSDTNADGTMLQNIIIHMSEDTQHKPWIWVLNCENMGLKEYTNIYFSVGLLKYLSKDQNLQDIWLINSNLWIQTTYRILNSMSDSKFLKQIKMIDGSILEKLDILKKIGLDTKTAHWLVAQ
jgi:hypothetical protein